MACRSVLFGLNWIWNGTVIDAPAGSTARLVISGVTMKSGSVGTLNDSWVASTSPWLV